MSKEEYMLTTVDNPYDPFTEYDEWYSFDQAKGYYTPEYLGNLARTSIELSDEDYELEAAQCPVRKLHGCRTVRKAWMPRC